MTFEQRARTPGGRFDPNHREFGMHIRSEVARKPAMKFARRVANRASAMAPFAPKKKGDRRRAHLRGSYEVGRASYIMGTPRSRRAGASVYSDVITASTEEFGVRGRRPSRPLATAARVVARRDLPAPGAVDFGPALQKRVSTGGGGSDG